MDITAQTYLSLADRETQTISALIKSTLLSSKLLSAHCIALFFDSRALLKNTRALVSKSIELKSGILLDEDLNFIAQLERLEREAEALYLAMGRDLLLCRYLLKRAKANYGIVIDAIIEHDAAVLEIPTTELPFNFNLDRMKQAVEAHAHRMLSNLTFNELQEWMRKK